MAILAGYVPWHGWDGWEMHNGYLLPTGYTRDGISPGDWFSVVFLKQLVTEQCRQIEALEERVRSLQRRRILAELRRVIERCLFQFFDKFVSFCWPSLPYQGNRIKRH